MYIIQYSSFCFHPKYPQNECELPNTYPEPSPLSDESKHTFPKTPALWLPGTTVTADFLDFPIPVTEHHTGFKTGCRGFHGLILQIKYSKGWSQSGITGALFNTPPKCSDFPTKASIRQATEAWDILADSSTHCMQFRKKICFYKIFKT